MLGEYTRPGAVGLLPDSDPSGSSDWSVREGGGGDADRDRDRDRDRDSDRDWDGNRDWDSDRDNVCVCAPSVFPTSRQIRCESGVNPV
jgi:hypothetical protein